MFHPMPVLYVWLITHVLRIEDATPQPRFGDGSLRQSGILGRLRAARFRSGRALGSDGIAPPVRPGKDIAVTFCMDAGPENATRLTYQRRWFLRYGQLWKM